MVKINQHIQQQNKYYFRGLLGYLSIYSYQPKIFCYEILTTPCSLGIKAWSDSMFSMERIPESHKS